MNKNNSGVVLIYGSSVMRWWWGKKNRGIMQKSGRRGLQGLKEGKSKKVILAEYEGIMCGHYQWRILKHD